jgi:membrane protease YdiL (CAAX protease family)
MGRSTLHFATSSRLYSIIVFSVIVIGSSLAKGNGGLPEVEANPIHFMEVLLVIFAIGICIWFVRSSQSSLPRQGYLDPAITPTMAILLAASMLFLGVLGAWVGISQVPEGQEETILATAWISAGAMLAQIPVLMAYATLRKRCGSRNIVQVAFVGYAVFVPLALATASIFHIFLTKIGVEPPEVVGHKTLSLLADGGLDQTAWVVIICATIGAGITEEVFYRGLILPTFVALFNRKTAWGAILATSIIFALMHAEVATYSAMAGLFVLSLGLCWARVKSSGVLAPIVIHIVFNAMNIAIVYSTTL